MSLEDRIRSEQQCGKRLTNNDLVCKDCEFRFDDTDVFGNTSICDLYESGKPNAVLYGNPCPNYLKEF